MDQVEELLGEELPFINWRELLKAFSGLDESERQRFSWVAPNEIDLKWLKEYFLNEKIDRLIGIGCGSGFLERIIGDFCGVSVTGVELKNGWWTSKYCSTTFVHTEFAGSPIEENFFDRKCFCGTSQVLFFCYFNNSAAFNEYLSCFHGQQLIIVGPKDNVGVHTDPLPLSPNILQDGWRFVDCRYLEDKINVICIYRKEEN